MYKNIITFFLLSIISILNAQDIIINEFSAKNHSSFYDNDYFQFSDWIELYNNTSNTIDLSNYFLSDDSLIKTKWQFPSNISINANSFLIIWADNEDTVLNSIHTSFKLSSDGGFIALYKPDTTLESLVNYLEQFGDISYGQFNGTWYYYPRPTPNAINSGDKYTQETRSIEPIFSHSSGFYNSTISVSLSVLPFDVIYYTTDGSTPDNNSEIFINPISIDSNTVIKAINYSNGKIPSKIISKSYFINTNKDLPIASLIIDPDFLWSDSIGIFNDSNIAERVDWERYAIVEYFENKNLVFNQSSDIRLFGATAYELPQKSFAVFPKKEINHKLFKNKDLEIFDSFIFRSSSDDWNITMMKDGFVQSIIEDKINIDYQAYQPTVMYINGEYFGIFNLREKYNEDYLKNNHGIYKDSIDMLQLNYWGSPSAEVSAGSNTRYFEMIDFVNNTDLSIDANFTQLNQYLDIDNYTNYIITQIYTGNRSYKHNITTWRENNYNDTFKWLIKDLDRAFQDAYREIFLMIYDADPVLNNMLDNLNYRNHFLQMLRSHINVSFDYDYINNLVDSIKNNIASEMPNHINRWASYGGVSSMSVWEQNIQNLKTFSLQREDTLTRRLIEFYSLDGRITVDFAKTKGGTVEIEDVEIPYMQKNMDYFKNVPVKFVAKPYLGYNFIEWENISTQDNITFNFDKDTSITAIFEADCTIPALVNQDAIFLLDCSPYYIDYNITVDTGATLYCEPGVEIHFEDTVLLTVKGKLEFIGTSASPIKINDAGENTWKYILSDNGLINMKYVDIYSGEKALLINGGNINVDNCIFYESNTDISDMISINGANINFTNNTIYSEINNDKKDAVDCGYLISGYFSHNKFYNVSDDCIDIGSYSANVNIEYNQMFGGKSAGISIGESTVANIYRNIVSNCEIGIQSHTNATGYISNNTLYGNLEGIRCYHYPWSTNSEGTAYVENTIFSNCTEDFTIQTNSIITIKYSLSDKMLHTGISNIFENPQFVDTIDFELMETSPCINAGNPLSPPDFDGTIADIGAKFYNTKPYVENITDNNNTINIFPNPYCSFFNVENTNNKLIKDIIIYNTTGEKIYEDQNILKSSFTIHANYKGLILVKIIDIDNNIQVKKLIAK